MLGLMLLNGCSSIPSSSINTHASNTKPKAPVIALVLGGGGAKGFAHVGVIKALEANNIHPNLVVGTSVGSFVGSIYASGKSINQLQSIALNVADSELTDFTLSYQGIIEGEKLREFVNYQVNNQSIDSFPIRFAAVAAEKSTLKKVVFTKGEAGLIVQASSSVPNVFIAPRIPDPKTSGIVGKKYIDGGVVSIVPVDAAKDLGADVIIAVDLQVGKQTDNQPIAGNKSIWSLIEQGYHTYTNNSQPSTKTNPYAQGNNNFQRLNDAEIARADVVILPDVANFSSISTVNRKEAIEAGVKATELKMPAIKEAIEKANLASR
ncbi:patatin-like phospholipase family protein [Psychrobacter sp.]|uniref:patatin-like phospholipase family protein n=1 Tax=Psychrobacter sp. TaxID=56811 RepID=UPI0025F6C3C2|nr:patatin-like phospholipase family protein [Psychrobacter sp.]